MPCVSVYIYIFPVALRETEAKSSFKVFFLWLQMWWWPSMVFGSSWKRTHWTVRSFSVTLTRDWKNYRLTTDWLQMSLSSPLCSCRWILLVQICPLELHCLPHQWVVRTMSPTHKVFIFCKTGHRGSSINESCSHGPVLLYTLSLSFHFQFMV